MIRDQPEEEVCLWGKGGRVQLLVHKEYSRWKLNRFSAAKTWQREKPWHIQGTPPECQIPRSLPPRDSAAECSQQSEQAKTRPGIPSLGEVGGRPWQGQENPALQGTGCSISSSLGSNLFDNHFWLRHHPLSINKSPSPGHPDSSLPGKISWYEQLLLYCHFI